jgi:hypothetical protein
MENRKQFRSAAWIAAGAIRKEALASGERIAAGQLKHVGA